MRLDLVKENRPKVHYNYFICKLCGRPINVIGTVTVRNEEGIKIEVCKSITNCGKPDRNLKLRRGGYNGDTATQR